MKNKVGEEIKKGGEKMRMDHGGRRGCGRRRMKKRGEDEQGERFEKWGLVPLMLIKQP